MKKLGVILVSLLYFGSFVIAQVALKTSEVKLLLAEIKQSETPDQGVISAWNEAIEFKKSAELSITRAEAYQFELTRLLKFESKGGEEEFDEKVAPPKGKLVVKELENKIEVFTRELDTASSALITLRKTEQERQSRIGKLPNLMRETKQLIEKFTFENQQDMEKYSIEYAKYQKNLAHSDYLKQLLNELKLEEELILKGDELLKFEKRIEEKKVVYYTEMVRLWGIRLKELRRVASASEKEQILMQIERFRSFPELLEIGEGNLVLVEKLDIIRNQGLLEGSAKRLKASQRKYRELFKNWEYARNRISQIESAGLKVDKETGFLLRQQLTSLPETKEIDSAIAKLSGEYTAHQLELLQLNNQLEAMPSNVEAYLSQWQKKNNVDEDGTTEIRQLLSHQSELLSSLIKVNEEIASNKSARMSVMESTRNITGSYSTFINERLIWIASADGLSYRDVVLELKGIKGIFFGGSFSRWAQAMHEDMIQHPLLWLVFVILLGSLLFKYRTLKSKVCQSHQRAARRNCQTFLPTKYGAVLELIPVLPLPLLMWYLSWRSSGMALFENCFSVGAVLSFLTLVLWSYSRSDGFIESNFKLDSRQTKLIRDTMTWFIPVTIPLLMLFSCLSSFSTVEPYGRVVFIVSMLVILVAFVQLFKPKRCLINRSNRDCLFARFVFLICIGLSMTLIIATWLGYYSSAIVIWEQFLASVWVVVVSLFIAALFKRWFLVSSRKIAIRQALQRRDALIRERELTATADPEAKVVTKSAEEVAAEAVNLVGVKEQTSRLVKVALVCSITFSLLGIWSQSLPALSILDKQKLWERSTPEKAEDAAAMSKTGTFITDIATGKNQTQQQGRRQGEDLAMAELDSLSRTDHWVTLQDVFISLIIFILTYVAAKNVPGLLEISILDHLKIKSGAAFAITTTVRYIIVLLGVIWAFANIGVTWSSIQWIAAAVTLGIGFGLQEVFANFVAGLILLYERPIRLGDVVTVGEVSGRVKEINIRATTVLQFNNHELIVPNKEFITGQLINWTLSDNIIRAEVLIGVAYGSDTEQVKEELLRVAAANPKVLKNPATDVLFIGFGASSLDFKLRAYVAGYNDLISTQSELHFAVNKAFEEAKIEISFPQQDLHIKSIDTNFSLTNPQQN